MRIVKDGLYEREYYVYIKGLEKVEYLGYTWSSDIGKYVPNYNYKFSLDGENWEEFKLRMREREFISIDERLKLGTKRKF